ncbi:sulfite exporter TauE/SafE family protein [Paenibacillus aceris]|uniref:Probable membrane transporter protein n=1 Tax=Paenibacillus aceris TaxID=869555 RepID=A0ABS4I6S3_9BACL|nr:sulfite exporter TauE/SafE family protein [Paenibacillus aceris]MBP1966612.1 putative membrane protein YfcA [Paenibacillus aceris]NHW38848.1 sulfite exporter TauE/SafE family protein [Paenibacillus aceris]
MANVEILATMLLMGMILGFAGTGGSGFIIGILLAVFHIPVHTALGTSIAAMVFTTLSGSVSHFREGNARLRSGLIIGTFGAGGAYAGTFVARMIAAEQLIWLTSGMLFISGLLIWLRTSKVFAAKEQALAEESAEIKKVRFWVLAAVTGLVTGSLSGVFGIGSTPFIQLALLILFGFPLKQAVGTTMVVILPIALFGSIGFFQAGFLDFVLLTQVVAGTMIGSYIGAKFTKRAPKLLLRTAMIMTPIAGSLLMLVNT